MSLEIIYIIYMYKKDLALNNTQWLICRKSKPNQIGILKTLIKYSKSPTFNKIFFFEQKHWVLNSFKI